MNQQATLESTDFVHLGDIFDTLIRIPTLIPNNKSILKAKKLNLYIILTHPVCAFFFFLHIPSYIAKVKRILW